MFRAAIVVIGVTLLTLTGAATTSGRNSAGRQRGVVRTTAALPRVVFRDRERPVSLPRLGKSRRSV